MVCRYLATITSSGENDFIQQKLGADAWIGASDEYTQINTATGAATYANQAAAEGHWYWVTGPAGEIGTNFSNGNTPTTVVVTYANWNSGEPNNSGGNENYGEIYSSAPSSGKWNDLGTGSIGGYVVEYGGMAGDPVVTLTASKTVNNTPSYTVTYNGNGNTGGTAPTDGSSPYASGATVTVLGNTGSLTKTGYTFTGWNTAANGSGTAYAVGATFAIAANTTLYAQWTITTYTLTVTKSGTGTGTVTAGAGCTLSWVGNTGTCTVNTGTAITLTGTANANSTWNGWSSGTGSAAACTGTGQCSFNITQNSGVTATFTSTPSDPGPTPQPATEVIPNNNSQINYIGGWHSIGMPGAYSGGLMETENITGNISSMSYTFEGTRISWRAIVSPRGGTAKVYIDGTYMGRVSLYRTFTDYNVEVFSRELSYGTHTLRIVPEALLPGRSINIDVLIVTK